MKSVIKVISTFVSLLSVTNSLNAQVLITGSSIFSIDVDYARFLGNDTLTYVELYYSVSEKKITYRQTNDKFIGGINVYARVKQNDQVVWQKEWTAPHVVSDSSQLSVGNNIVGITSFALVEGRYECEVRAHDFHDPRRSDTIVFPLLINGFSTKRVSLSDIEICTSIRRSEPDTGNVFYKNTLEVIPNVSAIFGDAIPVLFYYVEAYNLSHLPSDSYNVRALIHDAAGKEVLRQEKPKKRPGNTSVEVGTLNVRQLQGGTYTMSLLLFDTTSNVAFSSSKKFFLYKPHQRIVSFSAIADAGIAESEFAVMDENELDADFAPAKYIATENELKQYKSFSSITVQKTRIDSKRNFLYDFWKKRESGSDMSGNAFRKEYLKRVAYADERFSGAYRRGWQTDRGRVYILYGEPNEIDRFPNTSDNNPYEIWRYHQEQGGVVFVFVDRSGFGDWVLVHSTHRNELHDEGWERYIRK